VVNRVGRELDAVEGRDPALAPELVDRGRDRQVGVCHEPRLELGMRAGEREGELVDVTADPALRRPRVLQRLDVEEDLGQTAVLVAVIIATVSACGSSSSIAWSTVDQVVASRR
jgi:hypothetical protein